MCLEYVQCFIAREEHMDLVLALHGIQGKYLGGMGEGEVSWGCMAGRV